jgi:hypothetical protein
MKSRAALAASFVATIAASACSSSVPPTENPPGPYVETGNPPGPTDDPPPPPDPGEKEPTDPEGLPSAGPGENVQKRPDGTCYAYAQVDCPAPPVTCNPPPPRQVACPDAPAIAEP